MTLHKIRAAGEDRGRDIIPAPAGPGHFLGGPVIKPGLVPAPSHVLGQPHRLHPRPVERLLRRACGGRKRLRLAAFAAHGRGGGMGRDPVLDKALPSGVKLGKGAGA